MAFGIIIKGKSESKSKRFYPHMNTALGHYVHTKEDYLTSMKEKGLVPYEEPKKQVRKDYKPSKWAKDMARQIVHDTDSKGNYAPSSTFVRELKKKGYGAVEKNKKKITKGMDSTKGGFYGS